MSGGFTVSLISNTILYIHTIVKYVCILAHNMYTFVYLNVYIR